MVFRQLFEPLSSTYTYILGCEDSGTALLIDGVMPTWQRDLGVINQLGMKLTHTLDTHIHADHITSARTLKQETGSRIAHPRIDGLKCTDDPLEEGVPLMVGSIELHPLFTPGHTAGHHSYLVNGRVFTGDALLIDGCGRTDFQGGEAAQLYRSIHDKLFSLADETLVYPGHDYKGRWNSCIGQEKTRNLRLGGDKSQSEFIKIMDELKLAYPKFIDYALPGNQACGVCPEALPKELSAYCELIKESSQG